MPVGKPRRKSPVARARSLEDAFVASPQGESAAPPWEEIEAGRYQPRRIRGSCRGRALGWTFTIPPGSGEERADAS